MTTEPSPLDASDQVAIAVRALMPALRRQAMIAIALILSGIVATSVVVYLCVTSGMDGEDRAKAAMFAGIVGFLAVAWTYTSTIRRQEALVMPVLAQAIGLGYSKVAKPFLQGLPNRLLPARGIRKAEDHVHGTLGAHAIQMAEVHVETGGKNSRTLFKGIVAQFPNRVTMPAFFLALADKTRPGIFFGGDLSTEGLHHLRNISGGGGRTYGIWVSSNKAEETPALAAVIEILTRLEDHVGSGAELYAATSNGAETHIALSHTRNLFRVGGLFPTETEIFADVRAAMQDLTLPLTLAQALIGAEEAAARKS